MRPQRGGGSGGPPLEPGEILTLSPREVELLQLLSITLSLSNTLSPPWRPECSHFTDGEVEAHGVAPGSPQK